MVARLALLLALAATPDIDLDATPCHGGGLNTCGCHFNRKTNECHCHQDLACGCECQPARCG